MRELEREFQQWVLDLAARTGWRCWHVPTPMRPVGGNRFVPDPRGRGLPDLMMLHNNPPRLIFAELKNETGDLSADQHEFLNLARLVTADSRNVRAFVWRPRDRDLIEQTLTTTRWAVPRAS